MQTSRIIGSRLRAACAFAGLLSLAAPVFAQEAAELEVRRRGQDVERTIELPTAKADAVFQLLAPPNVRVVVSRAPGGLTVRGTAREIESVVAFTGLLMRDNGKDYTADAVALDALRKTWDSKKTYPLPRPAADALFTALAFNDVPVFVSNVPDGLTIEASAADQRVIHRMVRIMQGDSLADPASPADQAAPPPSAPALPRTPGREPRSRRPEIADELIAALEARVAELEKRLAALEQSIAATGVKPAAPSAGSAAIDAPRKADAPKKSESTNLIDRRYRLSAQHVDNLFNLFAPADIVDVIVSRDGNQLRIRASESDHETISRLVDLLNRGSRNRPAGNAGAPSGT